MAFRQKRRCATWSKCQPVSITADLKIFSVVVTTVAVNSTFDRNPIYPQELCQYSKSIGRLKNHRFHNSHKMEMTTISLTKEARDEIKTFGGKGDSYSDIVKKLVKQEYRENNPPFL